METLTHPRRIVWLKITIGLLFFISAIINAQTQVFPENDAIWCIKTDYQPKMLLYGLTGDTVINEKQYSKLYLLNDTTLNIDDGDQYIGGIREEEQKVWFIPSANFSYVQEEFLMYDFSRNIGDTVNVNFLYTGPFSETFIPIFISSNELYEITNKVQGLGGINHFILKRLETNSEEEWIENVGSTKGLFWFSFPIYTGYNEASTELVSLKQGDSIVYHNKDVCKEPFCWFGVGVEDTQQPPSIALYPNPVKETLHIDLGDTPLPIRFDLFDTQGHIIHTKNLTNPHTTVTPPPHSKGLHHYRLTGSDGKALQSGRLLLE